MRSFELEWSGDKKLFNKLVKMGQKNEVKNIVKKNGAMMHNQTLSNMDAAYIKGYSTGHTKRSTSLSITDGGLTAKQQTNTDYIVYLEHGTRYMAAAPAIKPAFDKQKQKFKNDLNKLVK